MSKQVECGEHGAAFATYVCQHVAAQTARELHSDVATADNPWPDAWCERCDEALQRGGGEWNDVSTAFAKVKLICHHCYERRRATLAHHGAARAGDPLLRVRYRCGRCAEIHEGLPDWGADAPFYFGQLDDLARQRAQLTAETCVIDEDRFIRGCLDIPIRETGQFWSFGVWTSLSERSFLRVLDIWDVAERDSEPPFFGWLSTRVPQDLYPETLNLKAQVYVRSVGTRPLVLLEPTGHPLAVDQREGITVERAREMADVLLAGWGGAVV